MENTAVLPVPDCGEKQKTTKRERQVRTEEEGENPANVTLGEFRVNFCHVLQRPFSLT